MQAKLVTCLDPGESRLLDGVEVTSVDANHCPGSLMFVFRLTTGTSGSSVVELLTRNKMIKKLPLLKDKILQLMSERHDSKVVFVYFVPLLQGEQFCMLVTSGLTRRWSRIPFSGITGSHFEC